MNNKFDHDKFFNAFRETIEKMNIEMSGTSDNSQRLKTAPLEIFYMLRNIQEDMKKSEKRANKDRKLVIIGTISSVVAAATGIIALIIPFFLA